MTEMSAATLRKWKILSNLLNEDVEKLVSLHTFQVGDGLGALLLTTDDEVYYIGGGAHALFRCDDDDNKEGAVVKSKVNEISGLGIKKLGVGGNFCVAITKNQSLLFWTSPVGTEAVKMIPDSEFVTFKTHSVNDTCLNCRQYTKSFEVPAVPGLALDYCGYCADFSVIGGHHNPTKKVIVRSSSRSKSSTQLQERTIGTDSTSVKLVRFNKVPTSCAKCNNKCILYSILDHEVNYCTSCKSFPQYADYVNLPKPKKEKPRSIDLSNSKKMIDLACGKEFFVALSSQNDLILWGKIAGFKNEGILFNPGNVIVKAISCGSNHVAVLTVEGELYTCGRGDLGQLGYEWTLDMGYDTLRKVPLDGKVAKVCCGYTSTVCLMTDGSLMCFGSHMEVLPSGELALNQLETDYITQPAKIQGIKRVTDLDSSPLTNIFVAKVDDFVFTWGRENIESPRLQLVPCGGNLVAALADLPASFTFQTPKPQQSTLSPHLDSYLYGNNFLSDLTLQLSDGNFPVHRLVLQANSVYFRDVFSKGDSENVLDMTNYNPEAYKCLIKYFYQVPPTKLEASDLFDLYTLAASYKEIDIAQDVFGKMKALLNPQTVLELFRKAKQVNCSEMLEECNAFISSPEFKHNLAEKVSQDPGKTMSLLEALDKNSS